MARRLVLAVSRYGGFLGVLERLVGFSVIEVFAVADITSAIRLYALIVPSQFPRGMVSELWLSHCTPRTAGLNMGSVCLGPRGR